MLKKSVLTTLYVTLRGSVTRIADVSIRDGRHADKLFFSLKSDQQKLKCEVYSIDGAVDRFLKQVKVGDFVCCTGYFHDNNELFVTEWKVETLNNH